MSRFVLAGLLLLLVAGCGSKPQQAVGVSTGPTIHYLLCNGSRVSAVRVTTPDGATVWEKTFPKGSTQTAFRIPFTPNLPVQISDPSGEPAMELTRIPETGIVRGDGRAMTAARFEEGRSGYCGAVRQDRAAALAIGFAFLVLAAIFASRWLRARRSRDPYDRAYR